MAPGVVPFGITLGVAAVSAGAGPLAVLLGAVVVYGGSAQLVALSSLHAGAGMLAATVAGVVVLARVMLYGAALEGAFRDQPRWFRLLAPHFIIDQTYLAVTARDPLAGRDFRRYWGWLGGSLLVMWTSAVAFGVLAGPWLPPLPHLALVGTGLFVGMLAMRLRDPRSVVAAVGAAGCALVAHHVVPQLGILVGAVGGVVLAMTWERRSRR
jgi:predicted branched-subunit amino acid permease